MNMNTVEIISQKLITDPLEIMNADIIDWNKLNGIWPGPGDALKTIFSWLDHKATMTIARIVDFLNAPQRNDWPGWDHRGTTHPPIGQLYWNWFFWKHPNSELHFSDSPDFYGNFARSALFWGDIGKVSASTFAMTQKGMSIGDLWISIPSNDITRQVIIEYHIDIPTPW